MVLATRRALARSVLEWVGRTLLLVVCTLLFACGGSSGGGGSTNLVQTSSKAASLAPSSVGVSSLIASSASSVTPPPGSSSISSSIPGGITLSGRVTYDFIPHNDNQFGLNYSATMAVAGRGLVVELLDSRNQVVATTTSDNEGNYGFDNIEPNKLVKVRVKAQLLRAQPPAWNFKITDNTNGNNLYAMDGALVAATDGTAVRNLHAPSGWTGTGYTQPRVAAPFAIADSVLLGVERIVAAGNNSDFPALELRWSINNKAADGDLALGEIGTSFYDSLNSIIYILGDEDNDTDEYDRHVILHEWGHYLEEAFARSDSIGGSHAYGQKLDMRVAMSEGFANAFSAMMLDDPDYRDSNGPQQMMGFINNVSRKNHSVRGWYSEASVQSVLYNFYTSGNGKTAREFTDIFNVVNSSGYIGNAAMLSIYVFADELRNLMPAQTANFNLLLAEQNIEITNAFGDRESNSGGYTGSLPIYKSLPANNTPVNVCSTSEIGTYNKLGVSQFFVLNIGSSGTYQINAQETGADSGNSDPDIYLYRRGDLLDFAEGTMVDQESLELSLPVGTYVVEVVDDRARNLDDITACFDVRLLRLN